MGLGVGRPTAWLAAGYPRSGGRRAALAFLAVGAHIVCKGCGLCVAECPCGAIEMVPEQI